MAGFGVTSGTIHVYEMASGKELASMPGHHGWVGSLVFWPDGKKLPSASADQTVRIWDLESFKLPRVLRGHIVLARLKCAAHQCGVPHGGQYSPAKRARKGRRAGVAVNSRQ